MTTRSRFMCAVAIVTAGTPLCGAQTFLETLDTPLLRLEDRFGSGMVIEAGVAAVSAPNRHVGGGGRPGVVLIYQRQSSGLWERIQDIESASGELGEEFGAAIAMADPWLAIGAPRRDVVNDQDAGQVDLYRKASTPGTGYEFVKSLTSPDLSNLDLFGQGVAFAGDTLAVGAPQQNSSTLFDTGAVYLFQRDLGGVDNWGFQLKLETSGPVENQGVGGVLEGGPGLLLVGSPLDSEAAQFAGAVFVFVPTSPAQTNWVEIHKVLPPAGELDDQFGSGLSLDGDLLAVGAPFDDTNGEKSGSVSVYRRTTSDPRSWALVETVTPPGNAPLDTFGASVSLRDGLLLAGAPLADPLGLSSGSAHLFGRNFGARDAWGHIAELIAPDGAPEDNFGAGVALGRGVALVGAPRDDNEIFDSSGTAYSFGFELEACPGDANGDRIVDMADLTAVLDNWLTDYTTEPAGSGPGDGNGDGVVDFRDVTAALMSWMSSCGLN